MTPLAHILRRTRQRKGYLKKALMAHLGVTTPILDQMEDEPEYISKVSDEILIKWLQFLNFNIVKDLPYISQYRQREIVYHHLRITVQQKENAPALCTSLSEMQLHMISDVIVFISKISPVMIKSMILPSIPIPPQAITEAISDIQLESFNVTQ